MEIAELRREKDDYFRHAHDSPLSVEQRASFKGLRYLAEDAAYRFNVTVDPNGGGTLEEVEMSDGSANHLRRVGTVRFDVAGERVALIAYEQPTGRAAMSRPSLSAEAASRSTSTVPTTRIAPTTTPGAARYRPRRTGSPWRSAPESFPSIDARVNR